MIPKDAWFLGLLALAYMYSDSSPAERTMSDGEIGPDPLAGGTGGEAAAPPLPARVAARDACPRDHRHGVALRADGAIWCHDCDEGFFPEVVIWESLMGAAAV